MMLLSVCRVKPSVTSYNVMHVMERAKDIKKIKSIIPGNTVVGIQIARSPCCKQDICAEIGRAHV